MATMIDLILGNTNCDRPGLYFEDQVYTHGQIVRKAKTRAAALLAKGLHRPLHVGVLLENVPEALFWLEGIALAGGTTVGINWTRRGAELGRDISHTDCQVVVTDNAGMELLSNAGIEEIPIVVTDSPEFSEWLEPFETVEPTIPEVRESDPFALIFTSGTTSAPKAAICTHGRIARQALGIGAMFSADDDVAYNAMPWFHSNAMYISIAPSIAVGFPLAMRRRFSASGWIGDVKKWGATYFNYVGKPLEYILATPERIDDADNRLRTALGNEANELDVEKFSKRFGLEVREAFGSTEMGITIVRVPEQPRGALGVAPGVVVMNLETREPCPRAQFDEHGILLNPDEAIGEFVNTTGIGTFEGYYNNEEANRERSRDGWYWSGDLGYQDEDDYLYFAGRGYDWLRVDGENFAAAPVERVLLRYPGAQLVAVYAVPDAHVGDRVMVAISLLDNDAFDPARLAAFLTAQADLGPKQIPTYVRLVAKFPLTATNKIEKRKLRADLWNTSDPVWIRDPGVESYRRLTFQDVDVIEKAFVASGRGSLLHANA